MTTKQPPTARIGLLLLAAILGNPALMMTHAQGASSEVEFSYDPASDVGPEFWKDLEIENNQCGGTSNSPIALETAKCTSFADYKFTTGTCTYAEYGFVINDHVEQASAPVNGTCDAATLVIPGVDGVFELLQFHVHTNSEHTLNGEHYGAELHMVHKLQGGDRLAVVGLFIQANAFVNNDVFSDVLAGFDDAADATAKQCNVTPPVHWWSRGGGNSSFADADGDKTVNVYGLIPENSTFYNYDGGLTTPPCSEIVEWNVADTPLSVSVAQYNDLSGLILNYLSPDSCEYATIASPSGSTSRPVQLLNNRTVERICPVGYTEDDDPGSDDDGGTGGTSGGGGFVRRGLGASVPALAAFVAAVATFA